jgi:hypothetical protein|tara:strand:+ start:1263 stop:1523 length:261 start_codon:yes stop_codon:yes gene_type:complete
MGDVIEFKKIEAKDTEESDEMLEEIMRAKTLIALILGKAEISIINGSLAMQSLVNKIIEDEEWDKEKFQIAAENFVLVTEDDKELH